MNEYDYKGYIITENSDGYFEISGQEFVSLDEAMDWIDDQASAEESADLHIFYVSYLIDNGNRHYDEYIWAYDNQDAIRRVKSENPDLTRILQCYQAE